MLLCLGEGPLHWEDNLLGVLGYYLGTHVELVCLVGTHLEVGHNYLVVVAVVLLMKVDNLRLQMNMDIGLEVLRVHQLHLVVVRNCIQMWSVDNYLPVGILDTGLEVEVAEDILLDSLVVRGTCNRQVLRVSVDLGREQLQAEALVFDCNHYPEDAHRDAQLVDHFVVEVLEDLKAVLGEVLDQEAVINFEDSDWSQQ